MLTNAEICCMEAAEIAGSVRAKKLSPLELVEAVLERMTRLTRLWGAGSIAQYPTAPGFVPLRLVALAARGNQVGDLGDISGGTLPHHERT